MSKLAVRIAFGLALSAAAISAAEAHAGAAGFILLLPTELYILGGALAVLVSFVVLALFHRGGTPPPERAEREVPRRIVAAASLLVLLFLMLLVAAGFWG